MENYETIRAVLGWSTVLNLGMLGFSALLLVGARGTIRRIHSRVFPLPDADLDRSYFNFLANYKIMIFVFNLAPYLAMRIAA